MKNRLCLLIVVLVLAGILIAARPAWLYEGMSGAATLIGGPIFAIVIFGLFLLAIIAALHYLRNRTK